MADVYDNTTSRAFRKLEETSQQHEGDIVTDLGVDRLILWIGTYILTALAVIVKVADVMTGLNLLCFPINDSTNPSDSFIHYSSNYCWETKRDLAINGSCSRFNKDGADFLPEPYSFKMMLLGLPYCLLGQGIIYGALWASWHVVYGSRLKGHLKFIQLFLEDTFHQLKHVDEGFYATFPYDRNCINFHGFKTYVNIWQKEKEEIKKKQLSTKKTLREEDFMPDLNKDGARNAEGQVIQDTNIQAAGVSRPEREKESGHHQTLHEKNSLPLQDLHKYGARNAEGQGIQNPNFQAAGVSGAEATSKTPLINKHEEWTNPLYQNDQPNYEDTKPLTDKDTKSATKCTCCEVIRSVICGNNMKDRHFFSMLCSENFSSLYHLPYILSVFKLSGGDGEVPDDHVSGNFPIHAAILRLWCHDKNMDNNIMLTWYLMKHIVTGILTALILVAMILLYGIFLHGAFLSTGNFRCCCSIIGACFAQ